MIYSKAGTLTNLITSFLMSISGPKMNKDFSIYYLKLSSVDYSVSILCLGGFILWYICRTLCLTNYNIVIFFLFFLASCFFSIYSLIESSSKFYTRIAKNNISKIYYPTSIKLKKNKEAMPLPTAL
jgi:hypothetical protein